MHSNYRRHHIFKIVKELFTKIRIDTESQTLSSSNHDFLFKNIKSSPNLKHFHQISRLIPIRDSKTQ